MAIKKTFTYEVPDYRKLIKHNYTKHYSIRFVSFLWDKLADGKQMAPPIPPDIQRARGTLLAFWG